MLHKLYKLIQGMGIDICTFFPTTSHGGAGCSKPGWAARDLAERNAAALAAAAAAAAAAARGAASADVDPLTPKWKTTGF